MLRGQPSTENAAALPASSQELFHGCRSVISSGIGIAVYRFSEGCGPHPRLTVVLSESEIALGQILVDGALVLNLLLGSEPVAAS